MTSQDSGRANSGLADELGSELAHALFVERRFSGHINSGEMRKLIEVVTGELKEPGGPQKRRASQGTQN